MWGTDPIYSYLGDLVTHVGNQEICSVSGRVGIMDSMNFVFASDCDDINTIRGLFSPALFWKA